MNNLTKNDSQTIVNIIHGNGGGLTNPKPFENDIFLFDTYLAGTSHIEGIEELEKYINTCDKLEFFLKSQTKFMMKEQ